MTNTAVKTEADTFMCVYEDILHMGSLTEPRGMKVLELEDYQFTLQPYDRFTSFEARKMSMDYIRAELIWYIRGNPFDDMITDHAQIWTDIRQPAGNFFSNYGQYIFGEQNGAQFVVDELIKDIDSRRAVIPLLNKHHMFHDNKDVVCTYSMSFRIRDSKLNMSVNMRSNDAVWGMTNDVACFSLIHEMILQNLRGHMPSVEMGTYTHKVDSLHVYERHFDMLHKLVLDGVKGYQPVYVPRIVDYREVRQLFEHLVEGLPIHTEYEFTKWLLEVL